MKRFLTIIAATAVAAAVTIPALADDGSPSSDGPAAFETCLRAHGIPVPAGLEGRAFKEWIGAHPDTAGLEAAFEACDPQAGKPSDQGPKELRTCLASKGLTPPADLDALKPWVLQQSQTSAGNEARKACGFAGVETKRAAEDAGPCGADTDRARSSRARRPKTQTTPTT